jgi:hypothetical protein
VSRRLVLTVAGAVLVATAWLAYRDAAVTLLLGESLFICG